MRYEVKEIAPTTPKGKPYYVVEDENGRVANECKHKTKKEAEKHCQALNAYFGDK